MGVLRHAKYGLAGAIGALAFVHTLGEQFGLFEITGRIELSSVIAGALLMIAVGKYARAL